MLALFLFILLETAWITHFVPSEIVVPAVAHRLVTGPVSFVVFVTLLTIGAVLGSLLAYYCFGYYSDVILDRYGDRYYLPASEIERSKRWFRRYGEGFLLWGRLVPVLRTPLSIPAGYARTPLPKFVAYSAVGWLAYNTVLVWLVYGGSGDAPISVAYGLVAPALDGPVGWLSANPVIATVGTLVVAGVAAVAWTRRDRLGAVVT